MEESDRISLDEAVHQFKISKTTLHEWLRDGKLKRYKREGDRRTFVSRRQLAELRRFREE